MLRILMVDPVSSDSKCNDGEVINYLRQCWHTNGVNYCSKIRSPKISSLSFFGIIDCSARGLRLKTQTQDYSSFLKTVLA